MWVGPPRTGRRALRADLSFGLPYCHQKAFRNSVLNSPYCKIKHLCAGEHVVNDFSFSAPLLVLRPHTLKISLTPEQDLLPAFVCWYPRDL